MGCNDPRVTAFRSRLIREAHKLWLDPVGVDELRRRIGWAKTAPGEAWCGIAAGACALRAGLRPEICRRILPSTYRLATDRPGEPGWGAVGIAPPSPVAIGDIQAGDVISVETSRGLPYGDHIAIVYAVLHDTAYTYEGNAVGLLPTGRQSPRRAFVRQRRDLASVRAIYRFGVEHMA